MVRQLGRAGFVLFLVIAVDAFAANFWFEDTYYDSTWSTVVGQIVDDNCDGNDSQWGMTSDYRTHAFINCSTGNSGQACQQRINGQWVVITCPW